MKILAWLVIAAVLLGSQGPALADSVPRAYQDLYTELEGTLEAIERRITSSWDGRRSPVVFSAAVIPANANAGKGLLKPRTMEVTLQYLDRLQQLGLGGVSLDVNFPILFPGFHENDADYRAYLAFYKRIAEEVRRRGLRLHVESSQIFRDYAAQSGWDIKTFYDRFTFRQYKAARLEMLETIATVMRPDVLTVVEEPDTEREQTGQPVDDLDRYIDMVNEFVSSLRRTADPAMRIGAGFGTWQKGFRSFVTRLAAETDVDFINVHVYPIQRDFVDRAAIAADIAASHGKGIALGEAWLYKIRNAELGRARFDRILARDVYSFWAPLDQRFLELMAALAHWKSFDYISPFGSKYFFAYLKHNIFTRRRSPTQLHRASNRATTKSLRRKRFTETGTAYGALASSVGTPRASP